MNTPAPSRPLLRYHGGKWEIGPKLLTLFPEHSVYCEPFGGGGSMLLRKEPCGQEFYNDLDLEVVNLFRVARDRGGELQEKLSLTPFARDEFDRSFVLCDDALEQARRTVIRAYMGLSGSVTRMNRDGSPQRTGFRCYARQGRRTGYTYEWANLPSALEAITTRLRHVFIENCDGLELMPRVDSEQTLHYVDPPYVHSTRTPAAGGIHRGYRFEMTDDDHRKLAGVLHGLRGMVVLSGYSCALYDELFAEWERVEFETQADGARPRIEVVWLNRRAQQGKEGFLL